VTFVAAVLRIAKMSLKMWAAVVGCVRINHTNEREEEEPDESLHGHTTVPRR